jgi:hypothetical protein
VAARTRALEAGDKRSTPGSDKGCTHWTTLLSEQLQNRTRVVSRSFGYAATHPLPIQQVLHYVLCAATHPLPIRQVLNLVLCAATYSVSIRQLLN